MNCIHMFMVLCLTTSLVLCYAHCSDLFILDKL